jgi:NAD-dependent dihydropyrimidine dehydrogenase PreA subunit
VVRYPDECWHCGACRLECPEKAISFVFPLKMVKI